MAPAKHVTAVHTVLAADIHSAMPRCSVQAAGLHPLPGCLAPTAPFEEPDKPEHVRAHVRGYARRRVREITQQQRWCKRIPHARRASPLTRLPVRRFSIQRTGFPYEQRQDITRIP
jgi:hypothetical protein